MATTERPARAADSEPGSNTQWDRPWHPEGATGPDSPAQPAHASVWHADTQPLPIAGSNHRNRARSSAERAFAGDRGTGYRR